jgi:transcriptional regulator with XRE-family HTH domain
MDFSVEPRVTTMSEENRREPSEQTLRIAQRLAECRRKSGISQNQLAEQLGLTQSMLSRYENGERRIPSELLAEFAVAIGVSADDLLGLKSSRKNSQELSDDMKKLWKKFQQLSKLPENDQRSIIRIINSVTKNKAS